MADLGERGQILLIAAFTLAVTFVALALVVNSAIFTENLASRGEVAGSSAALSTQHGVVESVGEAMAFANVYNYSSGGTLADSIEGSVSDIGGTGGTQEARGGQLVNVSYVSDQTGTRIADNDSSGTEFRSNDGREDWQVAEDVSRTRNFQIEGDLSTLALTKANAFKVIANESDTADDLWRLWIYQDTDLVVEVETADGATAECRLDTTSLSEFDLDVTEGVLNGQRCHALTRAGSSGTQMWFGTGIPASNDYNISFENGHNIDGNFSMVIQGDANSSNLEPSPDATRPFETEALYQTTIEYVFVTPNVRYVAEIRVAPGERPR